MYLVMYICTGQDESQRCADHCRYHGREPHLRIADAFIAHGEPVRRLVAKLAADRNANKRANDGDDETKSDLVRFEVWIVFG
mgnify:CR=1 FL=1